MVLLVAGTIRYGLLLTATTHRKISSYCRAALSSDGGGDDEDEDAADIYEDDDDGLDEIDISTSRKCVELTDDLVR